MKKVTASLSNLIFEGILFQKKGNALSTKKLRFKSNSSEVLKISKIEL